MPERSTPCVLGRLHGDAAKPTMPGMKSLLVWSALAVFVCALWLKQRLVPDPLVECDRAADW